MDRGQLEHDFAEFRRSGAADALGRVFDRAAPELLIVAGHVARDAASAEDLVQGTFLAACEHAQGWDPQRALMPWLVTILLNQARMQARRAGRAPEPPQERPVPHPIETAEANELAAALAHATAQLSAPYREVLALRLAHGLETREIAHALGRPLETVKTQLRRGLELLRAALPQSLATGLALVLANERGLAAVRVAVLAHAGGGSSLVATLGGILLMKKLLAGAALLLALLGIATLVALFGSDSGIARPGEEALASAATRGVGASSSRPDAAAATRESLVADSPPAAPGRSITGRCVRAEDRAPLAGVVARLTSQWADGVFRSAFGPPPAPATPVLTTGADGRFAFHARIVHGLVYRLELQPRGRVPRVATLEEEELASAPDFGDIEHAPCHECAGRVVDQHGAAVAGARLTVSLPADPVALRHRSELGEHGDSLDLRVDADARGRFVWPDGLPPGAWRLWVGDPSGERLMRLRSPLCLLVGDEPARDLVVTVEAEPPWNRLDVAVLDEHGRGVPGMSLEVTGGRAGWRFQTDAEGRCKVFDVTRSDEPWTLAASATDTHAAIAPVEGVRCSIGSLVLRTTTLPPRSLRLRVVSARDGKPVESYAIAWLGVEAPHVWSPGTHRGGLLEVPAVPGSATAVRVIPERDDLAARDVPLPERGRGTPEIEVRIEGCVRVPVRVADRAGAPAAGAEVELLFLNESHYTPAEHAWFVEGNAYDERAFFRRARERSLSYRSDEILVLSRARTASDGSVALWAPRAGMRVALRSASPAHAPRLSPEFLVASPSPQVAFVVERTGAIRGRVVPAQVARLRPLRVVLQLVDSWVTWPREGATRIDAGGGFAIEGVPPGDWKLSLCLWNYQGILLERPVRVAEGECSELVLDAHALEPATITGRVRLDGAPWAGAELRLWFRPETDARGEPTCFVAECLLDRDGRFTLKDLPPGEYSPYLSDGRFGASGGSVVAPRRRVPAGTSELDLDLVTRKVRVRVVDAETKEPIRNRMVLIETRAGIMCEPVTDEQGHAPLGFTPGDALWAHFASNEPEQGPFPVPREGDVIEIALRTR